MPRYGVAADAGAADVAGEALDPPDPREPHPPAANASSIAGIKAANRSRRALEIMRSILAEVRLADAVVRQQRRCCALFDDRAGLEHVAAMRDLERLARVLLDEQDR